MAFSEELKRVRKKLNLSQQVMAKELGVSYATLHRWEMGEFNPNYDAFEKFKKLREKIPTVKQIEKALRASYCNKTCAADYVDKFKKDGFSGQCVPTALVVQDYLGGNIMRAEIEGMDVSHFYNDVNGETIDLTKGQFSSDVKYINITIKPRDSFRPIDIQRYRLLKGRVKAYLSKERQKQ